jgi:hypothetical protein
MKGMNAKGFVLAVNGLVLNGAGLSVFGEAVLRKGGGEPWFWIGTLSLFLINAGICCVVEAARCRASSH